jgi:predicted restriction endonuclease
VNIASLDPAITASGRSGLGNASAADRSVWAEFHADWEALALESAQIRQGLVAAQGVPDEATAAEDLPVDDEVLDYVGVSRPSVVHVRVKQAFFRKAVLASYEGRCCITGLSERRLLVASHIVPWAADSSNRLNPHNGLCLSSLHDKAFDTGLLTLSADHRIVISAAMQSLADDAFAVSSLLNYAGQKIRLPHKFTPDEAFLEHHRRQVFLG